jgi:hypothetical protein
MFLKSSFSFDVQCEVSGGLIGVETFFGAMWDKNNNTPLFSLYHKFLITKNRSSNQKLCQL